VEKQFNQENALSHENKEMQMKETDLQKSEQKYRRIFEDSIDGLILWDNQHRITDINYAGEKMIGISKEKLAGHRIYNLDIFQDVKKQEIVNHIAQVFNNGKCTSAFIIDYEDGRKKYFEYSSKLNIVEGLNFTVFKDVTEKVAMQEQLRKSDTLTVIGELAAGIAHEIRNPMTALQRIDSIINEFLILAKPQAIRFQEKDINQIMKETVDLLTAQAVLYNVQFVTEYDEQLPAIFCEPNQLKKVFINLIKNAIEVMPGGGKITIAIKKAVNKCINITIEDEGTGIPEEMIKRLGEPFYTTKDRGTGLGLMVSYRIIDEHKGTIKVKSEEGKGTIFQITLPFDGYNSIN
jgi:two-component system, sporulation sensor kinase E